MKLNQDESCGESNEHGDTVAIPDKLNESSLREAAGIQDGGRPSPLSEFDDTSPKESRDEEQSPLEGRGCEPRSDAGGFDKGGQAEVAGSVEADSISVARSSEIGGEFSLAEFAEAAPSPLEPENLMSFAIHEGPRVALTRRALTTVPVRKPPKEAFVRTMDRDEAWLVYPLLERKDEGKFYLLAKAVFSALDFEGESTLVKARLVPAVDRQGNLFLWPLKVSDRESDWHVSANRAAILAKKKWIRVQSNMSAGAYDTLVASNQNAEPNWPEEDYQAILRIAFEGRVIREVNHPVLKELRGES